MSDAAKISLADQADYAHAELAFKHRMLPARVKAGTIKQADADRELALQRAIRDTLRLFAEHEDLIRLALKRAMAAKLCANDPAVAVVRDAFPDAELADVRPLHSYTGGALDTGENLEQTGAMP